MNDSPHRDEDVQRIFEIIKSTPIGGGRGIGVYCDRTNARLKEGDVAHAYMTHGPAGWQIRMVYAEGAGIQPNEIGRYDEGPEALVKGVIEYRPDKENPIRSPSEDSNVIRVGGSPVHTFTDVEVLAYHGERI